MFKSGLIALDQALFDGEGIPPGSLVEVYGTQDSGKTALSLWFCKHLQSTTDAPIGWVCAESNISKRNMDWAGVVRVRQSPVMPGLEAAILFLEEGCKLVIVESIASLVGRDMERPLTQVISEDLFKVKCLAIENAAMVLLTNQERMIPESRIVQPAGSCPALRRLVDCEIRLQCGQGIYRGGIQRGTRIYFQITKNGPDFTKWNKVGRFICHWDDGLRDARQTALPEEQ
jgi:hypothetical protein